MTAWDRPSIPLARDIFKLTDYQPFHAGGSKRGLSVRFVTAAALVHELMEARDERRLLRLQKQFANHKLLIIDELGFVPLSKTGAELLFERVSQRYERAAVLITSNLPFDEWTETFGTERLTEATNDQHQHYAIRLYPGAARNRSVPSSKKSYPSYYRPIARPGSASYAVTSMDSVLAERLDETMRPGPLQRTSRAAGATDSVCGKECGSLGIVLLVNILISIR